MAPELNEQILEWIGKGDFCPSSLVMAVAVTGAGCRIKNYPAVPQEFTRCLRLLDEIPETRQHMDRVAKISKPWRKLVHRWGQIEKTVRDEVGIDWSKGISAPRTYLLMKEVLGDNAGPPNMMQEQMGFELYQTMRVWR